MGDGSGRQWSTDRTRDLSAQDGAVCEMGSSNQRMSTGGIQMDAIDSYRKFHKLERRSEEDSVVSGITSAMRQRSHTLRRFVGGRL